MVRINWQKKLLYPKMLSVIIMTNRMEGIPTKYIDSSMEILILIHNSIFVYIPV